MLSKSLVALLLKAQMVKFLGLTSSTKVSKEELTDRLFQLVDTDEQERERLLEMFPKELAVEPGELERVLQCSKTERQRWVSEGKIPVLEYRSFRKGGRDLQYAVHDRRAIFALTPERIEQWRAEYQVQALERKQMGIQRALAQRKRNRLARQEFQQTWKQMVEDWKQQEAPELAAVLQLAYWTLWVSRWAKENHLKALKRTKHQALYTARRDAWYNWKHIAMYVMWQTSYARLHFYCPEEPHKYVLYLCEQHYEMKQEEDYETIWEFFAANRELVEQCPDCTYKVEKHFYSLYYMEVTAEKVPESHFSFHMPYPVGKACFPGPGALPKVRHVEPDEVGAFRFGRSLLDGETITHREQDVLQHFQQALAEVKVVFAKLGKEIELVPPCFES